TGWARAPPRLTESAHAGFKQTAAAVATSREDPWLLPADLFSDSQRQPQQQQAKQQGQNSENYELGRIHGKAISPINQERCDVHAWLQTRKSRPRHPLAAALSRRKEHPAHGPLHRAKSREI